MPSHVPIVSTRRQEESDCLPEVPVPLPLELGQETPDSLFGGR